MRTVTVAWSVLLVLSFVACETLAYTEAENLQYIEKILSRFNNQDKCELPNYEEIDVLLTSFQDLARIRGPNAKSKLTTDQEILLETVLYQWASFQKYMRTGSTGTVNNSAKFLGYVAKVIEYQKMRFGFSVCENERDRRFHDDDDDDEDDDGELQKNPLVRYLKHVRQANKTKRFQSRPELKVPEAAQVQVEPDAEPKSKVEASQSVAPKTPGVRPYRATFTYHSNKRPTKVTFTLDH